MKKKTGKSKGFVKKSKVSTDKDTNLLHQQHMELQKSNPNSLKEEAAAGRFEEQYFAIWAYKFRDSRTRVGRFLARVRELESAAE